MHSMPAMPSKVHPAASATHLTFEHGQQSSTSVHAILGSFLQLPSIWQQVLRQCVLTGRCMTKLAIRGAHLRLQGKHALEAWIRRMALKVKGDLLEDDWFLFEGQPVRPANQSRCQSVPVQICKHAAKHHYKCLHHWS